MPGMTSLSKDGSFHSGPQKIATVLLAVRTLPPLKCMRTAWEGRNRFSLSPPISLSLSLSAAPSPRRIAPGWRAA